jgi:hypothetical protein
LRVPTILLRTNMMPTGFFMSSSEGYAMESPRRCRAIARLSGEARDDYLLTSIEPPLNGQTYGLGGRDLDQVIIATRHKDESLLSITRCRCSCMLLGFSYPTPDRHL